MSIQMMVTQNKLDTFVNNDIIWLLNEYGTDMNKRVYIKSV